MAKKILEQLVDDLDGSVLEPGAGESVAFALNGKTYEIDLSTENAAELRAAFSKYIAAGRRTNTKSAATGPSKSTGLNLNEVRTWARANGIVVADRGRVPKATLAAYTAANN